MLEASDEERRKRIVSQSRIRRESAGETQAPLGSVTQSLLGGNSGAPIGISGSRKNDATPQTLTKGIRTDRKSPSGATGRKEYFREYAVESGSSSKAPEIPLSITRVYPADRKGVNVTLAEELRRKYALTSFKTRSTCLPPLLAINEALEAAAEIADQEHSPVAASRIRSLKWTNPSIAPGVVRAIVSDAA
jgi:hypothetical protein